MVDFGGAIKMPFSDRKTLIISFVIALVSAVFTPFLIGLAGILLLLGFAAETARNSSVGKRSLPEWSAGNLGQYFVKGLQVAVITIIYTFLGIIVLVFAISSAILGIFSSNGDTLAMTGAIVGAGTIGIIGLILFLIGLLLSPMAIMNFLKSNRFFEAFALGKILKKTLSVKYLVSLIVMVAYLVVLSIIGGILAITIIGTALVPGLTMYLFLVTEFSVFAQTYDELR